MKGFVAMSAPEEGQAAADVKARITRMQPVCSVAAAANVVELSHFATAVWSEGESWPPAVARRGALTIVGEVRLDNRITISQWVGEPTDNNDLELILAAYARYGAAAIRELHGAFAFVILDDMRYHALAVRDPFGVNRLFWSTRGTRVSFSSSLEILNDDRRVDEAFVWSFLAGRDHNPERTMWLGAKAVAPGSYIAFTNSRAEVHRYWRPGGHHFTVPTDQQEQVDLFTVHLSDAVRSCFLPGDRVWCELSGGLDTASVFGMAEHLFKSGVLGERLQGTYSWVDDLPGADERGFLNAILDSSSIQNAQLRNCYPWQDDGLPPPRTEQPTGSYPFWARVRGSERIVKEANGTAILSGLGGDFFLTGNPLYIADSLIELRARRALSQAYKFAVAGRQSFWKALWRYGLRPLFDPGWRTMVDIEWRTPAWIAPRLSTQSRASELKVPKHTPEKMTSFFLESTACELQRVDAMLELPLSSPMLDTRYPFFNRALIDFTLALSTDMIVREGSTKWILRQATRGIVPELVRRRRSKAWFDGRITWAMCHCAPLLDELLRDPLLAQAGWVDGRVLRETLEDVRAGVARMEQVTLLFRTLALETWLVAREGRWPDVRIPVPTITAIGAQEPVS
jgi:asparagine synthase (glutamine-hydrolysing)